MDFDLKLLARHLKKSSGAGNLLLIFRNVMSNTYRKNISKYLEVQQHELQLAESRGEVMLNLAI